MEQTTVTSPEILLISAVIQTGSMDPVSDAGITSEFFHTHRHEWEWLEGFLMKHRKVPDKPTFRLAFKDFPLLKTTDLEYAVDQVEKAHLRYQLTSTLRQASSKLIDDDPNEALSLIHSALTGVNHVNGSKEAHADVLRDYSPVLAEAEQRIKSSSALGYAGVSFGFKTLNERTGGLFPGDLAIWAARLSQGKTWMLCKVAAEAILSGKKVVFVSLEQTRSQIAFRIHTLLARELGYSIRHRDLMQGVNYDLDHYRSFLMALPERVSGSLVISDPSRGRANPFTLATLMERHSPDLMTLDYLTLMQQDSDDWRGSRKLSADTKLVAQQFGVPILAAAQINRSGDAGRRPPSSKHLAESDGIGQDADVIVTQKLESQSVIQALLAKNRSGQSQQIFWSAFEPNNGRIEEISHDEAMTISASEGFEDEE